MALSKKPVTGMKDILPAEMQVRDYVIGQIQETYKSFGFSHIETPCMESIGNLTSKQGGENEKLIFKVLKRGREASHSRGADRGRRGGLRHALRPDGAPFQILRQQSRRTSPPPSRRCRWGTCGARTGPSGEGSASSCSATSTFSGDPTCLAEIELMSATTTLLGKLGFTGFRVCFNDRRVLKGHGRLQRLFRRRITTRCLSYWIKWIKSAGTAWPRSFQESGFPQGGGGPLSGAVRGALEQAQDGLSVLEEDPFRRHRATDVIPGMRDHHREREGRRPPASLPWSSTPPWCAACPIIQALFLK